MSIPWLHELANRTGGVLLHDAATCSSENYGGINCDSRAILPSQLFIALEGKNHDGHKYIYEAMQRGAAGAVVARRGLCGLPCGTREDFSLVKVDNTQTAYWQTARFYRDNQDELIVISISGSNGKTTTKNYVAAVAKQRYQVAKTSGNFNNHIGVPLTLLKTRPQDEVAVIEIGMNKPGEVVTLSGITKPQISIITNIGHAHVEFLKSTDSIAWEKSRIISMPPTSGVVLLNSDDSYFKALSCQASTTIYTVGTRQGHVRAEKIQQRNDGIAFELIHFEKDRFQVFLPAFGGHVVADALLGYLAGHLLGIDPSTCLRGLIQVKASPARMELINIHGLSVIDDSYNASPESCIAAFKTLTSIPLLEKGRYFVVLGRLGELGKYSERAYESLGRAACAYKIDVLLTVGDDAKRVSDCVHANLSIQTVNFPECKSVAAFLMKHADSRDIILIKGSRSSRMEQVIVELGKST